MSWPALMRLHVLGLAMLTIRCPAGPGQLAGIRSAAQYLNKCRSYRGLETPYTGAEQKEAAVAVRGRSGRAARYSDEPVA